MARPSTPAVFQPGSTIDVRPPTRGSNMQPRLEQDCEGAEVQKESEYGLSSVPATPSAMSVPTEETPNVKRLNHEFSIQPQYQGRTDPMMAAAKTFRRPESSGALKPKELFSFAPVNNILAPKARQRRAQPMLLPSQDLEPTIIVEQKETVSRTDLRGARHDKHVPHLQQSSPLTYSRSQPAVAQQDVHVIGHGSDKGSACADATRCQLAPESETDMADREDPETQVEARPPIEGLLENNNLVADATNVDESSRASCPPNNPQPRDVVALLPARAQGETSEVNVMPLNAKEHRRAVEQEPSVTAQVVTGVTTSRMPLVVIEGPQAAPRTLKARSSSPFHKVNEVEYRVDKALPKGRHRPTPVARGPSRKPMPSKRGPSEEDLLLLLMHRSKQRLVNDGQLAARQKDLQRQNVQLQQENNTKQAQLDHETVLRTQAKDELEHFKEKYQKLKRWAVELNQGYGDLGKQGEKLKNSLTELKAEGSALKATVNAAQTLSTQASSTLTGMTPRLNSIRKSVEEHTQALEQIKIQRNEDNALLEERARNQRFEVHITKLETRQQRYDRNAKEQQEKLAEALQQLAQKLDNVQGYIEADPKPLFDVGECLAILQTLDSKNGVSSEDFSRLEVAIEAVSQKLVACETAIGNAPQADLRQMDSVLYHGLLEQIKGMVDGLRPDHEKFHQAQQEQARLEERVEGRNAMLRELASGKASAEAREQGLSKQLEQLVSQLSNMQNDTPGHLAATAKLQDGFSAALTKWNATRNELAAKQEKLQELQQEIIRLEDYVGDLNAQLEENHAQVQSAKEAVDAAKQGSKVQNDCHKEELGTQVSLKTLCTSALTVV